MIFRLWNYGLYGNENTWDIPNVTNGEYDIRLLDIPTWIEFIEFVIKRRVVGIEIGVVKGFGSGYVASLQLPTTYSTSGNMGYPDPTDLPSRMREIRDLYGSHK